MTHYPSRQEYLLAQKERQARRVLGVFPAVYPRELLWGLGALPAEIWDPPLATGLAHGHLQPYICSVVRLGLELILAGKAGVCDAFLFPHTCDSIQNLASVVHDFIGQERPCYFFYHPKAPFRPSSRRYYQAQLKDLAARLAGQFGALEPGALKKAVAWGQELNRLTRRLYELRAQGGLKAGAAEFYAALRQGEWLWPEDHLDELTSFLERARGQAPRGPRVVLSGILPNPPELLSLLDETGAVVAHDDLLACGRRLLFDPSPAADPWQALTDQYFSLPPCSTKGSPISERLEHLVRLAESSHARGVILLMVKFCEPELFDAPILAEELKSRGLATLTLEVELNQGMTGQMATRVEAFLEMLG